MKELSKNDMKVLWYLIPLWILGFLFGIYFIINRTTKVFKEYPLMTEKEAIYSTIKISKDYKSTTLIETMAGEKLSIRAYNYEIDHHPLFEHLDRGDSISRLAYSKKLYLYKSDSDIIIEFEVDWLE